MDNVAYISKGAIFNLPTFQRRLRHLRSIAVRNLLLSKLSRRDVINLETFFTLHVNCHSKEFYKSEKICGSLNPTWQTFDVKRFEDDIDTTAKDVVVKIWICLHGDTQLLMEWQINLSGLVFHADKLQDDALKYSSNSVIFGMFDKFFMALPEGQQRSKDASLENLAVNGGIHICKLSYNASSLERVNIVLRAVKQTQMSVNKIHFRIKDRLLTSQEKSRKLQKREALLLTVHQLHQELQGKMDVLQNNRSELEELQQNRDKLRKHLMSCKENLEKDDHHLSDRKKTYNNAREALKKEKMQLWIRRKQLVSELAGSVFPIVEKKEKHWQICGAHLPNSEDFQGHDELETSVALGYTTHLILMISHFLDIPLRYQMTFSGSRSTVYDHIHKKLLDKDREFPLYCKGRQQIQFHYGVYLLNKNISQIRFFCGMGTSDLRLTLHNIKSVLENKLEVKYENLGLHAPTKDSREKTSDTTDRQTGSSLASGGAPSIPDSAEVLGKNPVILNFLDVPNGKDKVSRETTENQVPMNSLQGKNQIPLDDVEGQMFTHSEDAFYRFSNPVSEQLERFHDLSDMTSTRGHSATLSSTESRSRGSSAGQENAFRGQKLGQEDEHHARGQLPASTSVTVNADVHSKLCRTPPGTSKHGLIPGDIPEGSVPNGKSQEYHDEDAVGDDDERQSEDSLSVDNKMAQMEGEFLHSSAIDGDGLKGDNSNQDSEQVKGQVQYSGLEDFKQADNYGNDINDSGEISQTFLTEDSSMDEAQMSCDLSFEIENKESEILRSSQRYETSVQDSFNTTNDSFVHIPDSNVSGLSEHSTDSSTDSSQLRTFKTSAFRRASNIQDKDTKSYDSMSSSLNDNEAESV